MLPQVVDLHNLINASLANQGLGNAVSKKADLYSACDAQIWETSEKHKGSLVRAKAVSPASVALDVHVPSLSREVEPNTCRIFKRNTDLALKRIIAAQKLVLRLVMTLSPELQS